MKLNKFFFIKPDSYDVVIIDDLHSKLFNILLKNKKFIVIPIRQNIPIIIDYKFILSLFNLTIKFKFNLQKIKKNYLSLILKFLKTKTVLTFYENTHRIDLLKKVYPFINFYTFPNGLRVPKYNYKHDNLISWGSIDLEIDKNILSKSNNYHILGSLRLLNYKELYPSKFVKTIDILYISSFSTITKTDNKNIYSIHKYLRPTELKILKILSSLNNSKKYRIKILMKNLLNDTDFKKEYLYLKNFFSDEQILTKKNYYDSYKFIEKSKITISLLSALGIECLSLNTRILLGFTLNEFKKLAKTWYALKYYEKYLNSLICLKLIDTNHIVNKINLLNKLTDKEYLEAINKSKYFYSTKPEKKKFIKIIYEN